MLLSLISFGASSVLNGDWPRYMSIWMRDRVISLYLLWGSRPSRLLSPRNWPIVAGILSLSFPCGDLGELFPTRSMVVYFDVSSCSSSRMTLLYYPAELDKSSPSLENSLCASGARFYLSPF